MRVLGMSKKSLILVFLLISISLLLFTDSHKEVIKLYARIKAVGLLKGRTVVREGKLRVQACPHSERAASYLDEGKYDEAIPEAKKALEIYPRYDSAYTNLAIAYYQKGLRQQAMETVKKALKINPNRYEALNLLGIIYRETGQLDKAIKIHRRIIEVAEPNDSTIHRNLALEYLDKGLFDLAEKEFDKVRSLESAYPKNLKDTKSNTLIAAYQDRIKADPCDARANYLLGEVYYGFKLYDLSIASFQKSIDVSPQYKGNDYNIAVAYNNLGASYLQKGMFKEAIVGYEKATSINPKLHSPYYGLAVAYWRKGDYREAINSCQQVLQNKPDFVAAQYIIGTCYERMNDYPRAAEEYKKTFKSNSSSNEPSISGSAHLRLAKCYINMKMKDKALEELNIFQNCFPYLDERRNPHGLLGLFSFMDYITVQIDGKTYRGKEEIQKVYKDKFPDFFKITEIKNEDDRRAKAEELFDAGNMYLAFGLNDEAIRLLQESIHFGHYRVSKAHFSIGVAYLQKGLLNEAINAFYRAIRIGYWTSDNFFDEIYKHLFLSEELLLCNDPVMPLL